MKKNVGITDKWIRILIAVVILVLYGFDIITGTTAMVLFIVGIILLLTSLISFCPLYTIFGINTCKKK
jgi:uncharacterized membrane protein YtjA (UPF0391 family)